jgi:molybdate-binding protein/DNA-binding transcriptional regulator YhcF (GntR family)
MLTIHLTKGSPEYAQIVEQIRLAVARGELRPGERLEPVRELAGRLGVNPSTTARAYRELEQAGVIETHGRRGTHVAQTPDVKALADLRAARLRGLAERAVVEALAQGYTPEEIEAALGLQLAAWRERRARPPKPLAPEGRGRRPAEQCVFAGSHDLALEALWAQARRVRPDLSFTANYVGSLGGLSALLHGEADLAGAHILDEETGEYNAAILRRLFLGQRLCMVTLAEREQGLIVSRGNPRGLHTWADLAQPGLRFVNRQPGSGTRTLLDYHLRRTGIAGSAIVGYATSAATHLAVAAEIAEGRADAGLGLYAAARAHGLTFVPLARERYDLTFPAEDRGRVTISALLDLIASREFRDVVAELGGYDTTHTGQELWL